jgi:hypothetical protein
MANSTVEEPQAVLCAKTEQKAVLSHTFANALNTQATMTNISSIVSRSNRRRTKFQLLLSLHLSFFLPTDLFFTDLAEIPDTFTSFGKC